MLKKLLLFVFAGVLVYSCEPEVKNNKRLIVKGFVYDQNESPVSNIAVKSEAYDFNLGNGLTDEHGRFEFVSLASDYHNFKIFINKPATTNYNSGFSTLQYTFERSDFEQTYNLSTSTLRKTALLDLKIEKTSTTNDTLHWFLDFVKPYCWRVIGQDNDDCYATVSIFDDLGITDLDYERQFQSVQNSEAVFRYKINSGDLQTVNIELNQDTTTYVFDY